MKPIYAFDRNEPIGDYKNDEGQSITLNFLSKILGGEEKPYSCKGQADSPEDFLKCSINKILDPDRSVAKVYSSHIRMMVYNIIRAHKYYGEKVNDYWIKRQIENFSMYYLKVLNGDYDFNIELSDIKEEEKKKTDKILLSLVKEVKIN